MVAHPRHSPVIGYSNDLLSRDPKLAAGRAGERAAARQAEPAA